MATTNASVMPCAVTFRTYRKADLDAVFALHVLAAKAIGAYVGGRFDHDFADIEGNYGNEFFVGELDNQIIAMGALRKISADTAEVRRVRVHPRYQRQGLGQAVLDQLQARAIEIGYTKLKLDTLVTQKAAQALYRKNGFVEIGRQVIEQWQLILFEKQLTPYPAQSST